MSASGVAISLVGATIAVIIALPYLGKFYDIIKNYFKQKEDDK